MWHVGNFMQKYKISAILNIKKKAGDARFF